MGKLGCPAEAAVNRVEVSHERSSRLVEQLEVERPGALGDRAECSQLLGHFGGGLGDLFAPFFQAWWTLRSTRGKPAMPRESVGGK